MASIKPEYRPLPVKLTDEERLVRASEAALCMEKYTETEEKKKAQTKLLGDEMKEIRAKMETLQRAVRTGLEIQPVQVETLRNEAAMTVELVRVDTGEVVESRAMTVDERQGKLFSFDFVAGAAAKKAKGEKN